MLVPRRCRRAVLGLLVALTGVLGGGLRAEQQSLQAESELLESLRALGVGVQLGGVCGAPGQLATYNMGANLLCLGDALLARPNERSKVLHHEVVHVVQDCLDGLESPTSMPLAEGLRRAGSLSERQLNGFFLQHLRNQGNLDHVVATTAVLPQDSRQREIEAYALQADPALVQHLLKQSCRRR
ncbi:MAG: hypothetical protein RLZZ515_1558 [Cyanobacteriota bacterium]